MVIFNFKKFEIKLIVFLIIIQNSIETECNISTPIRKEDNQCYLAYCTEEEFETGKCTIDNNIIKTQWLNKIIIVGDIGYKFISLTLSSKKDLFLHTTTPQANSKKNYFFGIKLNGRPYFNINGNESMIIDISYKSSDKTRTNGEIINLIIKNKPEKEYIMSIGKTSQNVELFDFEINKVTILSKIVDLTKFVLYSKNLPIFNFIDDNNRYCVFSFIGKKNEEYFFVLQKYEFIYDSNDNKIKNNRTSFSQALDKDYLKFITSCYMTKKKLIVCFYCNYNYTVTIFDKDLNEKNSFDFGQPLNYDELFFQCIHLKDEIGIFYYFLDDDKPIIDIIEFKENSDGNFISNYLFDPLTTKKDSIDNNRFHNSITKINDNKFGLIQVNKDYEIIYIIIYHIFNKFTNIIVRYYTIDIFNLYNLKVAYDTKSIIFNSFFVSAFGFYTDNIDDCNSCVIIFSYPDSKDFEIDLIDHLKKYEYYFPLEDIIQNKIKINNNLFGLVMKGIQIKTFPKNNDKIAISLFSNNKNYLIKEDEIIDKKDKIEFYFPLSELNSGKYIIEYAGVVTEPNFNEYNSYCEIDSTNGDINEEKKEFEKLEYIGKTGYISIKINDSLTDQCNDKKCLYCLQNDKDNCISFKKQNSGLDERELKKIYNILKEILSQKPYNGENIVINMEDIKVQLSSLKFQENSINDKNTSNVILGECEQILKEKYNLQDDELLMMIKLDLFKPSSSTPIVEYEVYNYNKSQKLNLEYCNGISINILFPIEFEEEKIILYNDLNSSGYDLFDSNDTFYNDICSTYTTFNGTDITISDRQKEFYDEDLILCKEDGCIYDYYDSTINKVKCHCPVSKLSLDKANTTEEEETNLNLSKNPFLFSFIPPCKI